MDPTLSLRLRQGANEGCVSDFGGTVPMDDVAESVAAGGPLKVPVDQDAGKYDAPPDGPAMDEPVMDEPFANKPALMDALRCARLRLWKWNSSLSPPDDGGSILSLMLFARPFPETAGRLALIVLSMRSLLFSSGN
ncbi:unnamed protein product [Closterium sp. NIES-54]